MTYTLTSSNGVLKVVQAGDDNYTYSIPLANIHFHSYGDTVVLIWSYKEEVANYNVGNVFGTNTLRLSISEVSPTYSTSDELLTALLEWQSDIISNRQKQSFGEYGSEYIITGETDAGETVYKAITALEASSLTLTQAEGDTTLTTIPVPAGLTIYGLFASISVVSGKVLAYIG
jgi:hypothetical protein